MVDMSFKISVVARVAEGGAWLVRLVDSLDTQDLSYDDFEVVFLVPDSKAGIGQRLTELSGRRPNVRVAAQKGDAATLAKNISGEWVLDLGPDLHVSRPVLFPQALSRLVDFGTSQDCQAVVGRAVSTTGEVVDGLLVADRPRLDVDMTLLAAPGKVIAMRRDLAMSPGLEVEHGPAQSLTRAEKIGVLGAYPSLLITPPQHARAGGSVLVDKCIVKWHQGRVVLTVTGSAEDASGGNVLFGLRHKSSGLEYWLPSSTANCAGEKKFSGTTEIDVRTAALGAPLFEGAWTVSVAVRDGVMGRYARSPLPPTSVAAGIIDGILAAATTVEAQFALDVGATRSGIVPRVSPADVDIAESARGTLMTVRLGCLAVEGDSRIAGSLFMDKFSLPAYLVAEAGQARIECFLSGLAGTSALSTQFGSGAPQGMGLNLVISPTGIMTVAPASDQATNAPTATPADAQPQAKTPTRAADVSVVVRLRRRVPAPIEPAVRLLARNKIAARVYRTLMTRYPARR
jgi:hypothetical protein